MMENNPEFENSIDYSLTMKYDYYIIIHYLRGDRNV